MTWNYPDDFYCVRCGCGPPQESSSPVPPPRPESNVEDVDEFGRAMKKPESSSSGTSSGKVPEWPPKFETNGSSFVFDARSGMFYDADSDFFYDPKTKLYYGNKKRAYYRYNDEARVPFEEVRKVDPTTEKMSAEPEAEPALAPIPRPGSSKDSSTKGISIKLKTKSLGSSKKSKAATIPSDPSPPSSRQQKQHVADMDKWADRQVEKRVDASQERTIKRTAKGEPICSLCKRKFPSVEKLLYHERVSNLHKENLAKQAAAGSGQKASEEQPQNYTDRAEQRRMMHGPEITQVVPLPTVNPEASLPITPAIEPTPQGDSLSETNIGNQLLQKMGWKEGKSLGRPISSSSRESTDSMTGSIKKDWDRIEALTASGGRATSSGSKAGLGKQH